jgi:hypothetical protein
MVSQLYRDGNVSFVCGRNFTYNGESYSVGDDFDQDVLVGRTDVDTLVRSRHLIPVVENASDKIRTWHREVKVKSVVLDKLGQKSKPKSQKVVEEGPFDPSDHTVTEVLEYLTSDISNEEYERVLNEEREGKARKGILSEEESDG